MIVGASRRRRFVRDASRSPGPGFINFRVDETTGSTTRLREVVDARRRLRRAPSRPARRAQVEFVSANPTGPLHIGHARNAALGDALARLLEVAGWDVEREYYFNDAGGQMDRFGASVEARYLQLLGLRGRGAGGRVPRRLRHRPRQGHPRAEGPGLADLPPDERLVPPPRRGRERVARVDRARRSTASASASTSHVRARRSPSAARSPRRSNGSARPGSSTRPTARCGSARRRSATTRTACSSAPTGEHTYFAADCAYLIDKFSRGFDHLVYVWGADHHGDVARRAGAAEALGYDPDARRDRDLPVGRRSCAAASRCR